ncbi:MAG: hypothetical protein KC503_32265 [Myxococcales bacterium]|nr:hypothetical protein [Myxococcales bacterium]
MSRHAFTTGSVCLAALVLVTASATPARAREHGRKVIINYKSGWQRPHAHIRTQSGWTRTPGVGLSHQTHQWWRTETQARGALQLLFNNGDKAWDKPAGGGNYRIKPNGREVWVEGGFVHYAPPGAGRLQTNNFFFHGINDSRPISVYLPAGYDQNPNKRYPVLYMTDGQNAFVGGVGGGWHVNRAIEHATAIGRARQAIVVAVHTAKNRIHDLTPSFDASVGGGGGASKFLGAIVSELKPQIDRHFRTLADRDNTALGGSSLGGLFALYAARTRPDVFGGVLPMSPSLWWNNEEMLHAFRNDRHKPRARIIFDSGDSGENGATDGVKQTEALRDIFVAKGMRFGTDYTHFTARGHAHKEKYWRERFADRYSELFPY